MQCGATKALVSATSHYALDTRLGLVIVSTFLRAGNATGATTSSIFLSSSFTPLWRRAPPIGYSLLTASLHDISSRAERDLRTSARANAEVEAR